MTIFNAVITDLVKLDNLFFLIDIKMNPPKLLDLRYWEGGVDFLLPVPPTCKCS